MPHTTDSIRDFFKPKEPFPTGMYHYISPQNDPRNYRLHLRIEPGGNGTLIINASTVLHLNQTAAEYAYFLVHNFPQESVAKKMSKRYRITPQRVISDYQDISNKILTLIETPDLDPITYLDFERIQPFSGHLIAPYRMDCAITYKLPQAVSKNIAPIDKVVRELTTDEWKLIIDKAWKAGIPHIIFTGGEPTLRSDLPDLIAHAERNDQVTGLLTDGLKFVNSKYLDKILQTGLDHVMMIFQNNVSNSWKALQNIIPRDIFIAVHLTLDDENKAQLLRTMKQLSEKGVTAISLSSTNNALVNELNDLRNEAAALQINLIWNLPVPYSAANPVEFEIISSEIHKGAGRAWLYVEPDGDVRPTQGDPRVIGNLFSQNWDEIWKN